MQNFTDVKLEIFVPQEYALKIRDELAKIGVGRIGNYDHCMAMYPVQGSYRPMEGANPFEGAIGAVSEGTEYKMEINCRRELVEEAIKVIKSVHPYEEPLINVIPLANHLFGTEQSMTHNEIVQRFTLLPEGLAEENVRSWQHIVKLFGLYTSGSSRYKPLLDLVKTLSNSIHSKLFRAGASVTVLMISTKEKNGLEKGDPYTFVALRDDDMADIGYYAITTNEAETLTCKNNEIMTVLLPLLDRLWKETRGKKES